MSMPAPLRGRWGLAALLTWIVLGAAQAQPGPPVRVETGFERDVNRYRWTAEVAAAPDVPGWDVALRQRFTSDAYLLADDRLSFRDESRLGWQAGRALRGPLALQLRGRMAWYSLSRVWSQEAYAGLRYAVREDLWMEPALGVAWDRRPGVAPEDGPAPLRLDAGPAYGVRLAWTPDRTDDLALQVRGHGAWQAIAPRRGRELRLTGEAERLFEDTRLSADVQASSFRRDAYQAVSLLNRDAGGDRLEETIEATASDTLQAVVGLETPLAGGWRLQSRVDVAANDRTVNTLRAPDGSLFFDTDFRRRRLEAEVGVVYEGAGGTRLRLAARATGETERRALLNRENLPPTQAAQKSDLLQQADYDEGVYALQGQAVVPWGRLVLSADGQASILRHDTPTINPDDRDEAFFSGQAGVLLPLSRYLEADVRLFASSYHTVYLKAARSGENNRQRSLRLRPSVRWRPTLRTDLRLSSEVRATYTVDDFVLPGRRPTDQSARELRYGLEAEHDLGRGRRLRVSGSYSDLRLGRFLDDVFAEIPFDTLRTYSGWVRLQAGRRVVGEIGVRLFVRRDYSRSTLVRYPRFDAEGVAVVDAEGRPEETTITRPGIEWIEQAGPTCAIIWPMRRGSALRLDGWVNVQRVRQRLYGDLPEDAAARIRRAARRGRRTILPNVALTMTWQL